MSELDDLSALDNLVSDGDKKESKPSEIVEKTAPAPAPVVKPAPKQRPKKEVMDEPKEPRVNIKKELDSLKKELQQELDTLRKSIPRDESIDFNKIKQYIQEQLSTVQVKQQPAAIDGLSFTNVLEYLEKNFSRYKNNLGHIKRSIHESSVKNFSEEFKAFLNSSKTKFSRDAATVEFWFRVFTDMIHEKQSK